MNAKKVLATLIALFALVNTALGAVSPLEAWIERYNGSAQKINASMISEDMLSRQEASDVFEFALSEYAYLVLYMNEGVEPQAFMMETFAGDESAKNTFACALAACDEAVFVDAALNAFEEAMLVYEKDESGEAAYYAFGNWMLCFFRGYDDGKYEMFSALSNDIYQQILDEEENAQADSFDGAPDEGETQPDEKKDDQPTEPESDKTPEESKIHKL